MTIEAPWPGDAAELVRWIRASLQPDDAGMVRGLEDVQISADVVGADVSHLLVDATSVELSLVPDPQVDPAAPPTAEPEVLRRTPGMLRSVRLIADPVTIEGIPLSFDVDLHDAPVEWLVYAAPVTPGRAETMRGLDLADDGAGMRGSLSASIRGDDLAPLLTAVLRPLLTGSGVHLRRLRTRVTQDGADGIRIDADAGIRWRVLGASARGTARVGVSPAGVITVRDLVVGSRNPLVAIALRAARRSVREQIGASFDLNDELALGAGPRLTDVRVSAGEDLRLSARLV